MWNQGATKCRQNIWGASWLGIFVPTPTHSCATAARQWTILLPWRGLRSSKHLTIDPHRLFRYAVSRFAAASHTRFQNAATPASASTTATLRMPAIAGAASVLSLRGLGWAMSTPCAWWRPRKFRPTHVRRQSNWLYKSTLAWVLPSSHNIWRRSATWSFKFGRICSHGKLQAKAYQLILKPELSIWFTVCIQPSSNASRLVMRSSRA